MRSAALALVWTAAVACGSVPVDPGARIFPVRGVIRGTVAYQGPRPCSRSGHIVGNAIVLAFDRRNPPPPNGVASTATNFTDVTGDVLFANEPRYSGPDLYCPAQSGFMESISASAPFEIAPIAGGSYEIHAFFDATGNFLPGFTIRNGPERGDVGGGDIDGADALRPVNAGNPDYAPRFLPVDVGQAQPLGPADPPTAIPNFVVPPQGFVADNVTVTIGAPLASTRPYFYAQGVSVSFDPANPVALSSSVTQSSDVPPVDSLGIGGATDTDANALPILTIPQDIGVLAPPSAPTIANANLFESKFPHLRLNWGVAGAEMGKAVAEPFDMQVAPFTPGGNAGFMVWQNAGLDPSTQQYVPLLIPEGNGVPQLWPLVVLSRIADSSDGAAPPPVVVMQGITLFGGGAAPDSLLGSVAAALSGALFANGGATGPRPVVFVQDHLDVLLRPSVLCFDGFSDSDPVDKRATLVTPHRLADTADLDCSNAPCVPGGTPGQPVVSSDAMSKLSSLVKAFKYGCLPLGHYAINVVYPDGQAWTVPNEAGACAASEGSTDYGNLTCSLTARPVLYSQGKRAVVEVVPAQDPAFCVVNPVPKPCPSAP